MLDGCPRLAGTTVHLDLSLCVVPVMSKTFLDLCVLFLLGHPYDYIYGGKMFSARRFYQDEHAFIFCN